MPWTATHPRLWRDSCAHAYPAHLLLLIDSFLEKNNFKDKHSPTPQGLGGECCCTSRDALPMRSHKFHDEMIRDEKQHQGLLSSVAKDSPNDAAPLRGFHTVQSGFATLLVQYEMMNDDRDNRTFYLETMARVTSREHSLPLAKSGSLGF